MNATEANRIQAAWLGFDCSRATVEEQKAICALFETLPASYISQNDHGAAAVLIQHQPINDGRLSEADAVNLARKHGVQTALRWHARGFWFPETDARPTGDPR